MINQDGQAPRHPRFSALAGVNLFDDRLNLYAFGEYEKLRRRSVIAGHRLAAPLAGSGHGLDADPTSGRSSARTSTRKLDNVIIANNDLPSVWTALRWGSQTTVANNQPASPLNEPNVPVSQLYGRLVQRPRPATQRSIRPRPTVFTAQGDRPSGQLRPARRQHRRQPHRTTSAATARTPRCSSTSWTVTPAVGIAALRQVGGNFDSSATTSSLYGRSQVRHRRNHRRLAADLLLDVHQLGRPDARRTEVNAILASSAVPPAPDSDNGLSCRPTSRHGDRRQPFCSQLQSAPTNTVGATARPASTTSSSLRPAAVPPAHAVRSAPLPGQQPRLYQLLRRRDRRHRMTSCCSSRTSDWDVWATYGKLENQNDEVRRRQSSASTWRLTRSSTPPASSTAPPAPSSAAPSCSERPERRPVQPV
jgi:hypothetical protein